MIDTAEKPQSQLIARVMPVLNQSEKKFHKYCVNHAKMSNLICYKSKTITKSNIRHNYFQFSTQLSRVNAVDWLYKRWAKVGFQIQPDLCIASRIEN